MPFPRRRLVAPLALAVLGAGCAAPSDPVTSGATRQAHVVGVSVTSCGKGWDSATAGRQRLVLDNQDSRPGEAQLVGAGAGARTGAVYLDEEPLGPGTRVSRSIVLAPGKYRWRCLMEDEAAVTGPVAQLHGPGGESGTVPGVRPVTQADLIGPVKRYESYVRGQLPIVVRAVGRLAQDVAGHRRASARRDWLSGHLAYERLGAAYEAFGQYDDRVNGLPDGLQGGVHSPHWTGFHRVEHDLWHGVPTVRTSRDVSVLASTLRELGRYFRTQQIEPTTLTIRAHEITENAVQLALTGQDDFGSGSDLATVAANLDGTRVVLRTLRPVLRTRVPMSPLDRSLDHAAQVVRTHLPADGSQRIADLPREDRESIDAAVADLDERLASVASVLEPRRTS